MRRVVWTRAAITDVARIRAYIGQFNPIAAQRMRDRLLVAADTLAEFPERGRPSGRDHRELAIIPPYLIRYRIRGEGVEIIRVRHGAQRPLP